MRKRTEEEEAEWTNKEAISVVTRERKIYTRKPEHNPTEWKEIPMKKKKKKKKRQKVHYEIAESALLRVYANQHGFSSIKWNRKRKRKIVYQISFHFTNFVIVAVHKHFTWTMNVITRSPL